MPFRIEIANTQDYFLCGAEESLLHGMVRYAGKGIPVGLLAEVQGRPHRGLRRMQNKDTFR